MKVTIRPYTDKHGNLCAEFEYPQHTGKKIILERQKLKQAIVALKDKKPLR